MQDKRLGLKTMEPSSVFILVEESEHRARIIGGFANLLEARIARARMQHEQTKRRELEVWFDHVQFVVDKVMIGRVAEPERIDLPASECYSEVLQDPRYLAEIARINEEFRVKLEEAARQRREAEAATECERTAREALERQQVHDFLDWVEAGQDNLDFLHAQMRSMGPLVHRVALRENDARALRWTIAHGTHRCRA
jgi:hypothetical protein